MFVTKEVKNFDKFIDVNNLQLLNIFPVDVTFDVSKLDKSIDCNEIQSQNVPKKLVTVVIITSLLKVTFSNLLQLLKV